MRKVMIWEMTLMEVKISQTWQTRILMKMTLKTLQILAKENNKSRT